MQWLRSSLLACGLALLAALAPGLVAAADGQTVTVTISPQGNSGVSGNATVTDLGGGKTRVDISLANAGTGAMPTHLHQSSCMDAMTMESVPEVALTPIVNGKSTTDVSLPFQQATTGGYSVVVHQSAEEEGTMVACGVINQAPMLPATGAGGGSGAPLLGLSAGALLIAASAQAVRRHGLAPVVRRHGR